MSSTRCYVGLAQSFHLCVGARPLEDGDEVFSLIRESELAPNDYISRFFDTGKERQREADNCPSRTGMAAVGLHRRRSGEASEPVAQLTHVSAVG